MFLLDRSTYHYKSRRPGQAALEQRIKDICQTRVRYGYRRVHVLLRREGWHINQKKTRRIYRELGLQLRNKTPKRRVKAKLREDRRKATARTRPGPWTSCIDHCANGQQLKCLTVTDEFTKEGLADRRQRSHSLAAGHRRAVAPCERSWRTELPAQ